MRRREFIGLVGGLAANWPMAARAQHGVLPVVGFLGSVAVETGYLAAFRNGLSEQGYADGRNVRIEYRFVNGQYDRLPEQAAELASLRVNVIVAAPSSPAAKAAKAATSSIPIVFLLGVDPVEMGLVASYNSPGGNLTGVCVWQASMVPKQMEILDELLPKSAALAFLTNPNNNRGPATEQAKKAASELGRHLTVVLAGTEGEIDEVFKTLTQQKIGGLIVNQEAFFVGRRNQIATLGVRYKLPVLYGLRLFPEGGGFVSYAANEFELWRQTGVYTGKVLNGASPTNLPVLQPTKYELIVNLKTAKAIGIDIPATFIARADEVIE